MSASPPIERHAADLGWSLWTELGVPGVIRRHAAVVVDPEPLLVATPALAQSDQRLLDEALSWCTAHADRVSVSRLRGLVAALPDDARERFSDFASQVFQRTGTRWAGAHRETRLVKRVAEDAAPWAPIRLPLERPALLRLRTRALCGVGARADVLAALLVQRGQWRSAAELAAMGYAKRTIARILTEMADAGLVTRREVGNALRYRLAEPDAAAVLVADGGLAEPDWIGTFGVALELLDLQGLAARPPQVRRVAAHAARERLAPICAGLDLAAPPATRGDAAAWETVIEWGGETMRRFAEALDVAALR